MTDKRFSIDQVANGMTLCRPKLIETFPLLNDLNAQEALTELDNVIDKRDINSCVKHITITWLKQQETSCPYKTFIVPRIKNPSSGYKKFLVEKIKLGL